MKFFLSFFAAFLFLTAAQRTRCESFCKYRFCSNLERDGAVLQRENRAVGLGIPNVALSGTPCIVRRGRKIRLLSNVTGGEAMVSKEFSLDPYVPISEYRTDLVSPQIPANFFSWVTNERNDRPSVGRLPMMGNQEKVLDGVCARMPVSSYNIVGKDGSIRKNVKRSRSKDCVGFRTQALKMLVSFEWETSNDFDLRLEEPNGFEISRFGDSTGSPNGGKFTFDVGSSLCQAESGVEKVRYLLDRSLVEPGTYTIRIDHTRLCSKTSPYRLRVLYDEEIIFDESGELMEVGEEILVRTFTIPALEEIDESTEESMQGFENI